MKMNCWSLGAALLLAAGMCWGGSAKTEVLALKGADPVSRQAYFAQPIRVWGSNGYLEKPEERYTMITLSNNISKYVLILTGTVDTQGKLHASLGMLRPSIANWYSGGFFYFNVAGDTESNSTVELGKCENGEAVIYFVGKKQKSELRITLPEQDNKLLMNFQPGMVDSKPVNFYQLCFLCYPSSMGGGYNYGLKLRKREALTPERTLGMNDNTILTSKEGWVLFYDNWYDPALNRGDGGCALLYNPLKCSKATVVMGNYACNTYLNFSAGQPAYVILWDFTGWGNDTAKKYMKDLKLSFK